MKILSITAQKPHSTGSGTYLTELVNSFDRLGHQQAVIAGIYPEDTVSFPASVEFYPALFSQEHRIYGMSDEMPYPSALYSSMNETDIEFFEGLFLQQLDKAVSEFNPDVIICHHLFLLTSIVRDRYPDRYVIAQCHGSDLRQFKNCPKLQSRIRRSIASLDRIFALHEEQKKEIIALYGISPKLVTVNGSGYNDRLFNTEKRSDHEPEESLTIVYAGKISKPKGVPELLRAIEILSADAETPAFRVQLAGGCQDEDVRMKLNDFINRFEEGCGQCKGAEYFGLVPQTELAYLFRQADVFVLPSYFEGLGLVLIEAMAAGLVPVATRLPGIKEWIDSEINGSNVIYVAQPKMETVDRPFESELPAFSRRLADAIKESFELCVNGFILPDTSGIVWDSVAAKMLPTSMNR